jgi:hypothetical protein
MTTGYAPVMASEPGMPVPDYRLRIPQLTDWLSDNGRYDKHEKARLIRTWRTGAALLARGMARDITPVRIIARLHFTTTAARDPNNWNPTAKAIVDGLRDAGVLADDHAAHVIGPDMRLGPHLDPTDRPVIMLELWRLDPAAFARTTPQRQGKARGVRAARSDTPVTRARLALPAVLARPEGPA